MPMYKEYKGKYVFWAKKGTKGKGKPTGRIVRLPDRKPMVWYEGRGDTTLSYKRVNSPKKIIRQTRRRTQRRGFNWSAFK